MIPGEIITSFAEFQADVSVNDFRILIGFQELLQASCTVLSRFSFYLVFGSYWLGFHQVALIYHQPKLTLALESCHC